MAGGREEGSGILVQKALGQGAESQLMNICRTLESKAVFMGPIHFV